MMRASAGGNDGPSSAMYAETMPPAIIWPCRPRFTLAPRNATIQPSAMSTSGDMRAAVMAMRSRVPSEPSSSARSASTGDPPVAAMMPSEIATPAMTRTIASATLTTGSRTRPEVMNRWIAAEEVSAPPLPTSWPRPPPRSPRRPSAVRVVRTSPRCDPAWRGTCRSP